MNFITMKQLSDKVGGRARSSLYRDVESGRLPKPTKIGSRLYWNEAEIDAKLIDLAG